MDTHRETVNGGPSLTERERETVERRARPRVPVLYEVIRQEGEAELVRPASGLWWSGVAAGICIGFSLIAEGLLRMHLPDASWRPLVDNFGYTVGFLIVVLGRQQLFTENTITVVLPVMASKTWANFRRMLRLWGIVIAANLAGVVLFAFFFTQNGLFSPELAQATREISHQMMTIAPLEKFLRGIVAGWLIALMVWILPNSKGGETFVIILITYLIALGDFTHVVAGSVEAFVLCIEGYVNITQVLFDFFIPTLFGNVVGGTLLFAMLSYVQVQDEL